ncbi:trypsin-like peptidase domain-containing protein [Streptomyces yokosukanensis]|uniref:VMAP-C domain-containing protein n=1 Tax=Streptomyces yokosukanensis TaxID=67386 RepID=UPI00099EAC7E|nr:trypsin-like peptidase domain-containing protein [Streptomyces yokosukanensis]
MVRPSVARIGAPGDGYATDRDPYWGSGFFIAPGWLLTCAHVVGTGGAAVCRGERAMTVTWLEPVPGGWAERTGSGTARLLAPRPEAARTVPSRWPFPDLALVRVAGADDVPCLWLADREAGPRTRVGLFGWSVQTGELGIRYGEGELAGADAQALLLAGNLPVGGLSGGPVLDLRHGCVIGVIKGRGAQDGVAAPVTALYELLDLQGGGETVREVLRAHDLHHLRRLDDASSPDPASSAAPPAPSSAASPAPRPAPSSAPSAAPSPSSPDWTTYQAELPGYAPSVSGIDVALRTRLYGHLAQLPPPRGAGEVGHLVEDVKAQVRGERLVSLVLRTARTWREGAGLLCGLRTLQPGGGGTLVDLDAVLLYAAEVVRRSAREHPDEVDPARLAAFTAWISGQAAGHRHWAVGGAIRALVEGVDRAEAGPDAEGRGGDGGAGGASVPGPAASATGAPGAGTDVLVKVGSQMYDGRYPWSVQLIYGGRDITPVAADDLGARADELVRVLREPLALALSQGDHGEHLAAIEVFLPRRLFDLPVDEWQLLPERPGGGPGEQGGADDEDEDDFADERAMPLGMRRTVVVRFGPRNGREPSPEWRRRWKGVQCGPLANGTLHGRPVAEGHPPGARPGGRFPYYGALSAMGEACVPVYCGPVGSGEGLAAMNDALRAGHSVVLWRRDGHEHEECGAFHRQAADLLAAAGHAWGLHGPVRDLRIRLADPDTARAQGLRGKIAVLFDPPDRPPLGAEAMRPPPAAPGA